MRVHILNIPLRLSLFKDTFLFLVNVKFTEYYKIFIILNSHWPQDQIEKALFSPVLTFCSLTIRFPIPTSQSGDDSSTIFHIVGNSKTIFFREVLE